MDNHEEKSTMEGVINELRNVISNLGEPFSPPRKSTPEPEPEPEKEPEPRTPEPASVEPFNNPFEPMPAPTPTPPPVEPSPAPASNPFNSNGTPSDSDFWNGNVLGWPHNFGENEATPPPPPPPTIKPPDAKEFEEPTPTIKEFQAPPPSMSDRMFFSEEVTDTPNKPPPVFEKLPPAEPSPLEDMPFQGGAPWLAGEVSEPPPPPPPAPLPVEENNHQVKGEPLEIPEAPAAPIPIPIPIPGTWNGQERQEAQEEPRMDLEIEEIKPSGLVQIACLYPEGMEKQGQLFVSKLKEAAERAQSGAVDVQAVFVSGWNIQNLDLPSWKKSATLSGADMMFVLTPKKDFELFKVFPVDPIKDGIKTRYVMIEHVGLRTLYPDIVIELKRGR